MTVGFDVLTGGFDVIDSRFWWFWQVVLMVLMLLTVGFDDFDRWFWCFDSRFWWFWCLTAGFDVFDDFDSWFWWFWCFDSRFWWFWQEVFVFEGCILNHVIMTEGFVFWRRCYQEIPLPPGGAYLGLCCEKLWRLFTAVNKKLIVYKIAY